MCKALSDPNRVKIIKMLTDGEQCACKILEKFQITQPTLSHHMKILCESRIVNVRKEGRWSHYSLNDDTLLKFKESINEIKNNKEV